MTETRRLSLTGLRKRIPLEALAAAVSVVVVWLVAAELTEPYIVPPIWDVLTTVVEILMSWELLWHAVMTLGRVIFGLLAAFVVGTALGLWMGYRTPVVRFSRPLVHLTQGVPALSWVVIAIIWFQAVEIRIWFIMFMVTLPGFVFQTLDSYNAIPKELRDMARSLRPRRFDMFRTVTWPAIVPDLLTSWKVNIGLGTRVVLIAELVGASTGVGYQLLTAMQLFNMSRVVAWTAVLVLFVLIVQHVIERLERFLLRYRPGADQPEPGEQQPATVAKGAEA